MNFDDARQETLFTYWKQSRGDKLTPLASDIDPTKITSLLKDLAIFEVFSARDIRYRLAGTEVAERLGADPTGKNLLDIADPDAVETVVRLFENMLKQPAGALVQYENTYNTGRRSPVSSLFLPMAAVANGLPRVLSIHARDAPTNFEDEQDASTVGTNVANITWIDIGAGIPTDA